MIFFFDENFPKKASILLEEHTIIDIRGSKFEGYNDTALFKLVQEKKAVFLTTDKDFFHTIPYLFSSHYGVIVIALKKPNSIKIIDRLKWFINNFNAENYKNKVYLLTEDKCYLSKKINSKK